MKREIFYAAFFLAVLFFFSGCAQQPQIPAGHDDEAFHIHADFKAVLDGKMVDFNRAEYMSEEFEELNPNVHMHDFNPYMIHFHSADAAMGDFFKSLGMDFNSNCFSDGEKNYCGNENEKLQFYVNGAANTQFGNYKPADLDKILIYYGAGTPGREIFDSLTSWACVYSKKCDAPPGVTVEEESCTPTQPCRLPGT